MKIFIDNGHGSDTAGKRSPDGRFLEYKFNHIIASGTVSALRNKGLDAELLVPEENDITLAERCRRVNGWCREHGKDSCILVSIHANAFGNGREWTSPSGWSVYTSKGQTRADKLADCLFEAAKKHLPSMKMRRLVRWRRRSRGRLLHPQTYPLPCCTHGEWLHDKYPGSSVP